MAEHEEGKSVENNKTEAVALGLNKTGLIVFFVLLLFFFPACWLPWVVPSMRGVPKAQARQSSLPPKIILIFGLIVMVGMGLYPPWVVGWEGTHSFGFDAKYAWIFKPPAGSMTTLNFGMLMVQWMVVAGITGVLYLVVKKSSSSSASTS